MASWIADYDNGSNVSGDGSLGNPYQTIDKCIDVGSPNDTVYVRGAPYNSGEQYENSGGNRGLEPSKSGTSGNYITVRPYQSESVTILNGYNGNKTPLYLTSISYFKFIDLTFDYYGTTVDTSNNGLIQIWGASSYVEFTDCVVNLTRGTGNDFFDNASDGFLGMGVGIGGTSNNIIFDGVEILNGRQGIQVRDTAYQIKLTNGCHIHHNYFSALVVDRGSGPTTAFNYRILVENSTMEWLFGEDGMQCDGENGELVIEGIVWRNCILRGIGENALDFKATRRCLVENCYIYGIVGSNNGHYGAWNRDSWGSIMTGSGDTSADIIIRGCVFFDAPTADTRPSGNGFQVYNNTFVNMDRDYTGPNTAYSFTNDRPSALRMAAAPTNFQFVNNIAVGCSECSFEIQPNTNMRIDYNIWDGPCVHDGTPHATMSAWRTALQGDSDVWGEAANSLLKTHSEVAFVSVPSDVNVGQISGGDWDAYPDVTTYKHTDWDFRPSPSSPAISAGGPITLANGAGVSSDQLVCEHVRWAYDGYGITGEVGDEIIINSQTRTITSIDYGTKTLTLSSTASWSDTDPVYLTAYGGTDPWIGALGPSATGSIDISESEDIGVSEGSSVSGIGSVNPVMSESDLVTVTEDANLYIVSEETEFDKLNLTLSLTVQDDRTLEVS